MKRLAVVLAFASSVTLAFKAFSVTPFDHSAWTDAALWLAIAATWHGEPK